MSRRALVIAGLAAIAAVATGCGSDEKADKAATTVKTAPAAAQAASTGVKAPGLIAFRRYSDPSQSEGAVFTIKPDGTGERQLTHPPRDNVDDQPAFSPDGSKIAFERCPGNEKDPCHAYVINRDGSGEQRVKAHCRLKPVCDTSGPAWSDDGRLALILASGVVKDYSGGNQIQLSQLVIVDPTRGTQHTVAQIDHYEGDLGSPAWSPDGKRILYQRQWSHFSNKTGLALFTVSAAGGKAKRVTADDLAGGDHAQWSPDGRWIAFRTHADQEPGVGPTALSLIHPDGTGIKALKSAGDDVLSTGFSPDGKWITYAAPGVDYTYDVWAMRIDGSDRHPVTRSKEWDSAPAWGP
jgi:TolB protein